MTSDTRLDAPFWTHAGSVQVRVRLTPKGGRDCVESILATPDGPAVKARVRAVPEDGEANAAVEKLIANWVGIPRRDVELASGHKSRLKTLALTGDPAILSSRLDTLVAQLAAEQGATK